MFNAHVKAQSTHHHDMRTIHHKSTIPRPSSTSITQHHLNSAHTPNPDTRPIITALPRIVAPASPGLELRETLFRRYFAALSLRGLCQGYGEARGDEEGEDCEKLHVVVRDFLVDLKTGTIYRALCCVFGDLDSILACRCACSD